MRHLPFALLTGLLAAGCGPHAPTAGEPIDGTFEDEAPLTATLCPLGTDAEVCSGSGDVWSARYRVGRADGALGEVAQTFRPEQPGEPLQVRLKLRLLRDTLEGTAPALLVSVRPLVNDRVPTDAAVDLVRGVVPAALITRGLAQDLAIDLTRVAGAHAVLSTAQQYALVVSVDPASSGGLHVGVASHREPAYADGTAWWRGVQGEETGTSTKPFVSDPGEGDLSFALVVAPPVAVTPTSVQLAPGGAVSFSASQGLPPYSFTVASGGGSLQGSTYTAHSTAGTATVRVTDAAGRRADAVVTIAAAQKRVFVTSTTFTGNMGGLNGADAGCQARANAAGLGGTWKAWLSSGSVSARDRLSHSSGPYVLLNGSRIANSWSDLVDGSLLARIDRNEFNQAVVATGVRVWTNTDATGARINASVCLDWTSATSNQAGSWHGFTRFTSCAWTKVNPGDPNGGNCTSSSSLLHCSNAFPLYCFEQ